MILSRKFSTSMDTPDELRVVQFNILADGLSGAHPDKGGFSPQTTPPASLNWEYRRLLIVHEIMRENPHIICLQEVDHPQDLIDDIGPRGYASVFIPKRTSPCVGGPDGCLILYSTERFTAATAEKSFGLGPEDAQVAACTALYDKALGKGGDKDDPNASPCYLVCAAHFKANKTPEGEAIRVRQVQTVLEHLSELEQRFGATGTFLCADLNGTPDRPAYADMLAGGGGGSPFSSANKEVMGCEPPMTTCKRRGETLAKHTIDYIFYRACNQGYNILPLRHLELPTEQEIGGAVPNWKYPSDHFMLCVAFHVGPERIVRVGDLSRIETGTTCRLTDPCQHEMTFHTQEGALPPVWMGGSSIYRLFMWLGNDDARFPLPGHFTRYSGVHYTQPPRPLHPRYIDLGDFLLLK